MNSYQTLDIDLPIKHDFEEDFSCDEEININKRKRSYNKRDLYSKWYITTFYRSLTYIIIIIILHFTFII